MTIALLLLLFADPVTGMLQSESRLLREQGVERLGGPDYATSDVLALLNHDDERVRRGATRALARRADPVALPALLQWEDAASAEAIWSIAARNRLDLPTLALLTTEPMEEHLRRATAAAVHAHLGRFRRRPRTSSPERHRILIAGGGWAVEELDRIVQDPSQGRAKRAQAVYALVLMEGRLRLPMLVTLLQDREPYVRATAAHQLWFLRRNEGYTALAAQLHKGRELDPEVMPYAVSGATQMRVAGDLPLEELERIIRDEEPYYAGGAGQALLRLDRTRGVRAMVRRGRKTTAESTDLELGVLLYRCARDFEGCRALVRDIKEPLVRVRYANAKESLTVARAHLEPRMGSTEWMRVFIVGKLLNRSNATADDHLAFARPLLATDSTRWHATALDHLRKVPKARWADLRPRIRQALRQPHARTRVNAARLLMPDPAAKRVLWMALYDGDAGVASIASRVLGLERDLPVPERRRRARSALRALDREESRKGNS
ncbi:MAG: HEAT repeat domain-containing protein [Planctomycetota bacterium]